MVQNADHPIAAEQVDLSLSEETICAIALLARDLLGKAASTAPEGQAEQDNPAAEILEFRGLDSVEDELRHMIEDLDEEAQIDLVSLMWFGRDEDEWETIHALAKQEHTRATVSYLLGTPLLSDYLLAGMERLGRPCSPQSQDYR